MPPDEAKLGQQGLAARPWRDEQRPSLCSDRLTPAFSGEGRRRHLSGGSAVSQHELRAWLSSSAAWHWRVPTAPGLMGARATVQALWDDRTGQQGSTRVSVLQTLPHPTLWRGQRQGVQLGRTGWRQD